MFQRAFDDDLALRLLEERNTLELFEIVRENREHIHSWMTWVPTEWTMTSAGQIIRAARERFASNNGFWSGIFFRERLCGCVILNQVDWPHRSGDIGYWLIREEQGHGLVTRSCRALVDYCFEELQLHRIEIRVATENARSRSVPERLGFRLDGVLRQANRLHDRYVDLAVYSMLAPEWKDG